MLTRNNRSGGIFPVHHRHQDPAPVPTFGIPKLTDITGAAKDLRELFSDPNKMAKQAQRLQNLLALVSIFQAEAERRQANVQGVKDAERKAPIRAALMESLMSGGLGGFGSEFSPLKALARPRTFVGEGGNTVSTEGPGGAPASPEQLAQLDNLLEPAQFAALREKGRQAAAAQTPESIFTPTEGVIGDLGNTNAGRSAFVNNPRDAAEQQQAFERAGSSGLTPEQEERYGIPSRAMGGPVRAGQPYLVGEQGPEVVVPAEQGTVLPNEDNPEEHNRKQLKKVFQILSERGVGI